MHDSVMAFLRQVVQPADVRGAKVLEVGSMDVNGSPRSVIERHGPATYLGVDLAPGKGVDLVCQAHELTGEVGAGLWDLVVSTEMLEHAEDWRAAVREMKRAVRPGGRLILTARGPGFPFHGWPHDYWRFTPADFAAAFADFDVEVCQADPGEGFPGAFLVATRPTRARPEVDLETVRPEPVK